MNKEHYEKITEGSVAEWNLHVKKCREKDSGWRVDLYGADLKGVNLIGADLSRANLIRANLYLADLKDVDLSGADLREADLKEVSLERADLYLATLYRADLSRANLRNTNLRDANFRGADLREVNLSGSHYSISQMLMANWGACSDELTLQLMRLDAEAIPDGYTLMDTWAAGEDGPCPFNNTNYRRVAIFKERRAVWKRGGRGRAKTLQKIWKMLAEEKGLTISL